LVSEAEGAWDEEGEGFFCEYIRGYVGKRWGEIIREN